MILRSAAVAVAILLVAAGPQDPPRRNGRGKIDPSLAGTAAPRRLLLRLAPGAGLPDLPGLVVGERGGDIVTAEAAPGAIDALAALDEVLWVGSDPAVHPHNDISQASTIAYRSTISTDPETDTYSFAATAGQTVRIRVHTEVDPPAGLNPSLIVTDAGPIPDDDSGPGFDAEVVVTWATGGAKSIAVSNGVSTTTGGYLLTVTADTPILTSDLTGGSIVAGVSEPHVAGTRAREARAVEGLDGSGVVIGVIDSGIDFEHEDFRNPGPAPTTTRLLAIWDQTLTAIAGENTPDVGGDGNPGNDYGVEYTDGQINADLDGTTPGFVRHADGTGHGTHVAGIAAGDGSASAGGFIGTAPAARIVAVKHAGQASDVLNGIAYVLRKADEAGAAGVVINLSLGTHDGPHDGTSPFDQAVDGFVTRGRYVVVSAGNEGDDAMHAEGTVSGPVTFTYTPSGGANPRILDFWAHGSDSYTVDVTDTVTSVTALSGTVGTSGVATVANKTDSPSNGATHVRVTLATGAVAPWTITFTRTVAGGDGAVDGWIVAGSGDFAPADVPTHADGSTAGSVSEPGTAARAITVGAYRGKFAWDSFSVGNIIRSDGIGPTTSGNIAGFSSRGPTRDGRTKPDIAAPGSYIGAAVSTPPGSNFPAEQVDVDGVHGYLSGTSMAAPEVTGILALLLQKNRLYEIGSVKSFLASSAQADLFIGPGEEQSWGAGKVDAVGLLAQAVTQVDLEADAGYCLGSAGAAAPVAALLLLALLAAGRKPERFT